MTDTEKVDAYIKKQSRWSTELSRLREIFNETELKEEVKWGAPCYSLDGKLISGIAAFKNHYALWFFQGVFLKDSQKKLVNAQEEKTKALRQWRFEQGDEIEEDLILEYIQEAIQNSIAGKEIKPQRKKGVNIPAELKKVLDKNSTLFKAFKDLTPGKQREYSEFIEEAKREPTKQSRLEKITPLILEGKGLHDKYKNC